MKVVVFGGSGFLGSHVADELTRRSHDVTVYDTRESQYLSPDQKIVVGSILDKKSVASVVSGCDYVYNFAAVAGIEDAQQDPYRTLEINVMGNTSILEACRRNGVKRFIFASSVYVYSDLAPFYRSSKQACELVIEDYQKRFGLNYTILRYGSLYGKRANRFNFIYRIIQQALEEGRIVRKGDGEEIRDYINVLDAARCSVDILSDEFINEHVMLTGTQSTKIKDLLNMINEMLQGRIEISYAPAENEGHYEITPYAFKPRVAKKYVSNHYYDLGQGILDVIYDVYEELEVKTNNIESIEKLIESQRGIDE